MENFNSKKVPNVFTRIEKYINFFLNKEKPFLEWKGIFMSVDVYFEKNHVIINFKYENTRPDFIINYPKTNLPKNISSNLPINKDLKMIDKTSFFIIKPNDFEWCPVFTYFDYLEIHHAIIMAGKQNFQKKPMGLI